MQPAQAPRIELRQWDPSDWPIVWHWIKSYYWRVADDYAPRNERDFIADQMARGGLQAGVYRDGELGGVVICERVSPVLCEGHCYFKKTFWGWHTTLPALNYAFQGAWKLGYEKVVCPVLEKNRLMRSLLQALGAVQESHYRAQTRQHGEPIDVVHYSVFKEG